jgi:hypothetical protein
LNELERIEHFADALGFLGKEDSEELVAMKLCVAMNLLDEDLDLKKTFKNLIAVANEARRLVKIF